MIKKLERMDNGEQMEDEERPSKQGLFSFKREGKGRGLFTVFNFLVGGYRQGRARFFLERIIVLLV